MTKSERVLWKCLRSDRLGVRVRRQVPVGPYVLDFYCARARLCIEVDRPHHAFRVTTDTLRDECLNGLGILTLRIPAADFFEDDGPGVLIWIERIAKLVAERQTLARGCDVAPAVD